MSAQTQKQLTKGAITLKGSTALVTEYFEYAINQILYLRGIYPEEDFKQTKARGLFTHVTTDVELITYLQKILTQVQQWLLEKKLSRLVLTINSRETRETIERWQFNIVIEEGESSGDGENDSRPTTKTEQEINRELRDIMKQIVSTVTFLPSINEKCTFNILVYTDRNIEVPTTWVDSDPHHVKNSEQVRLRSFSTDYHRVETM
ncbi:Mitotic spindle checkpoint component mad2, partial [Spiromyces aspiralis]